MACKDEYAIKPDKPTKPENILSFQKKPNFSLKSDQINYFTNIWPNIIKYYNKIPYPKTHIEDKTNLTFLGIKWPTEVDMPLNKTQIQIAIPLIIMCVAVEWEKKNSMQPWRRTSSKNDGRIYQFNIYIYTRTHTLLTYILL